MFVDYLKDVFKDAKGGRATEPTYYPHLKKLLETAAPLFGKTKVKVDILPKRVEGGCPDIVVWDGEQHVFGYVECKDVGADLTPSRMSKVNKDQFRRYLETFPNLIYTNFTEFRLYRDHDAKPLLTVSLCDPPEDLGFKAPTDADADGKTKELLERFFDFSLAKKFTAKTLAQELAKRTRFLKDEVAFEQEEERVGSKKKNVLRFFDAFKGTLIPNLKESEFADLFAQTIAFGLFAARYRTDGAFNRKLAYDSIPATIGVLHDLFSYISMGKLPVLVNQVINDISELLSVADVHSILDKYFKDGKGRDPIFYFYETFLSEYDPKDKEQRGVFYTPEPVVSYIVRSVHKLVQEKFGKTEGLGYRSASDPPKSIMLLDPAGGTLTFVAEASKIAWEGHVKVHGDGDMRGFVKNHILENFYAFELMMAPYVLGHLKMSFFLEELGYELGEDERFKLYLTNTLNLDKDELTDDQLQMWEDVLPAFVAEADAASEVKRETPILVVIGNPPYSGHSANPSEEEVKIKTGELYVKSYKIEPDGKGWYKSVRVEARAKTTTRRLQKTWIGELIEDYKIDNGEPLTERAKWLHDDYVKFIRFAQWKIDQKGEGILGFITSHNYIDNATFKGMRQSLMHSFNDIYILDLHGSSRKKQKCPDGTRDENVFDIRTGTAIGFFVKLQDGQDCKVFHHERWGLREQKYAWLDKNDITTTKWTELQPEMPDCFFRPTNTPLIYSSFWPINEVMNQNGEPAPGLITTHDEFAISWTRDEASKKIEQLLATENEGEARRLFQLCTQEQWSYSRAKKELADGGWKSNLCRILYRPFDVRWTVYDSNVAVHRRDRVNKHMLLGSNLALMTNRFVSGEFKHVFCSTQIIDSCTISSETKARSYLFPLYLYEKQGDSKAGQLPVLPSEPSITKRTNINPVLFDSLGTKYEKTPSPEEVFYYIYAILSSSNYRATYEDALNRSFPRIPFTADDKIFLNLVEKGKELVELHLLQSKDLDTPGVKFRGSGSNDIVKVAYKEAEQRVYINDSKYFDGMAPEVWTYVVGGYQVLDKWLKERKKRGYLDSDMDEPKTFCRIATALAKTIQIQQEIDKLYSEVEKAVIAPPGAAQAALETS